MFPDCNVTLAADFRPVEYSIDLRKFVNRELFLQVFRNGALLEKHHDFLNEARLSAIALVVYMAGLLVSVPANSRYPKLLVLDDVLVGLDMQNRKPVLDILKDYFADWQIVLLTHDKVWYEMVQTELEGNAAWRAYELWVDSSRAPRHRHRESGLDFYLATASRHLDANDHHAAANYTRMAFEHKVKAYCDKGAVAVPYKKDPKNMSAESFWTAAKTRAVDKANGDAAKIARLEQGFHAVDLAQRIVMNPLSHSRPTTVTTAEIQAAMKAVRDLAFK